MQNKNEKEVVRPEQKTYKAVTPFSSFTYMTRGGTIAVQDFARKLHPQIRLDSEIEIETL